MLNTPTSKPLSRPLIDGHGRTVNYLRLSVTDRCDLRCTYCMAEKMTFLPRKELLTFEELARLCDAFIARGVRHVRITGGEPLVRKDIMSLIDALGGHLKTGDLDEVTLTTNGTQLAHYADALARAGMRRLNISLDTLDPEAFHKITRRDQLSAVMTGIEAAKAAGLQLKINTVALRHDNVHELSDMIRWAHSEGMDMTIIEAMPMGEIEGDRIDQYIPLFEVKEQLARDFTMTPSSHRTAGPSRYMDVAETGGRLGFITPLSHNFCETCNRVRITCTGQLYTCLGHEGMVDLRTPLRDDLSNASINAAVDNALALKPKGHDFDISRRGQAPSVSRHMSVTGG